jgi:hypothetical protein
LSAAAAKQFSPGQQLRMNFQSNNSFEFHEAIIDVAARFYKSVNSGKEFDL